MLPREITEKNERLILSEYACFADSTKGRLKPAEPDRLRTEFQRDRDKILHSNSFRRLKHKTQVYLIPMGDHYRTRLTHTLEVAQIARTIARALQLNEDLTEAIALGHDLGHTPFGHAGERALAELCPEGFCHYEQSLRVVDFIERDGLGLNLTYEVRDGILKHTNAVAETKEGYVVRLADVIAYINHDIDDSIRAGVISHNDLPKEATDVLGHTRSERITTLINSVVDNGARKLAMSPEVKAAHDLLHKFMFDNVYTNPVCKSEETKARELIIQLYGHYEKNFGILPDLYQRLGEQFGKSRAICDYIAGMTDIFAVTTFNDIFIPKGWSRF